METIAKWEVFEVVLTGKTEGNPFTDYTVEGVFSGEKEEVKAEGFYDGEGVYKVRFMPSFEGNYHYTVTGSYTDSNEPVTGEFTVLPAKEGNHGPVHVADTYHFRYADGTPYYSIGTT